MGNSISEIFFIIKEELKENFIGFTWGHQTESLNGLCVYKGPRSGRIYFRKEKGIEKQFYVKCFEEILSAKRFVILFYDSFR